MAADFVVWPSERQAVIEHTLYPNTHKSLLLSRYIPNPTPHIIVFMFSADPTVTLASGKLLEISSDVIVKSNAASLPIIQFATIQQLVVSVAHQTQNHTYLNLRTHAGSLYLEACVPPPPPLPPFAGQSMVMQGVQRMSWGVRTYGALGS